MGEGDHPAKEEALKRLSEPEGDYELHSVLERLGVYHPPLGGAPPGALLTRGWPLEARGLAKSS